MENGGYLFAAFAIVWAFVFVYIVAMANRQRRLRRELDMLGEAFKPEPPGQ